MIVQDLVLVNFRNYKNLSSKFGSGINVIIGNNAQGKTNLIESIYFLAAGQSFRHSTVKDMISFDQDNTLIRAGIISSNREQTLEAKLYRGRRRELYANGVKLKKTSDLTGHLSAVQFGPDDLNIIKESASVRRKLMDNCLSQLRPAYFSALSEYNRLYDNKSRILRDYRDKPSLLDLLDDFNLRLAEKGALLIYYRSAFAAALSRRSAAIHNEFSSGS